MIRKMDKEAKRQKKAKQDRSFQVRLRSNDLTTSRWPLSIHWQDAPAAKTDELEKDAEVSRSPAVGSDFNSKPLALGPNWKQLESRRQKQTLGRSCAWI